MCGSSCVSAPAEIAPKTRSPLRRDESLSDALDHRGNRVTLLTGRSSVHEPLTASDGLSRSIRPPPVVLCNVRSGTFCEVDAFIHGTKTLRYGCS